MDYSLGFTISTHAYQYYLPVAFLPIPWLVALLLIFWDQQDKLSLKAFAIPEWV
jgi:hypothetical protein